LLKPLPDSKLINNRDQSLHSNRTVENDRSHDFSLVVSGTVYIGPVDIM